MVILTLVVTWAVASLAPLFFAQIAALALVLAKPSRTVGLAKSVLLSVASLGAIALILPLVGLRSSITLMAPLIALVLFACLMNVQRSDLRVRKAAWSSLAGPLLLVGAVAYHSLLWGSVPGWSMSGDARNHYLLTEWISEAGGWVPSGYPALNNAITSLLGFGAGGGSSGSLLTANIQVSAQVLLLFLGLTGLMAGLVSAGQRSRNLATNVRAAAGSSLCVSPLFLSEVLVGGFHPVALTVLVLLCVLAVLALGSLGLKMALLVSGVGTILTLMLFPIAATIPASAFVAWWSIRVWRATPNRAAVAVMGTLSYVAAVIISLYWLGGKQIVATSLVANGGINGRDPELLLGVVLLAGLSLAFHLCRGQVVVFAMVTLSSATTMLVVWWIAELSQSTDVYYATKLVWIATVALLPVGLMRVADPKDHSGRGFANGLWQTGIVVSVFALLTFVPLLFETGGYRNPIRWVANGWTLPSSSAAKVMIGANDVGAPSFFFGVYDQETDRRLNIWSSAFLPHDGDEIDGEGAENTAPELGSRALTWAYSYQEDMAIPQTYCWLLEEYPQARIWTSTTESAGSFAESCHVPLSRVRPIPEAWYE